MSVTSFENAASVSWKKRRYDSVTACLLPSPGVLLRSAEERGRRIEAGAARRPGVFNARRPLASSVLDRIEHSEHEALAFVFDPRRLVRRREALRDNDVLAGEKALIEPVGDPVERDHVVAGHVTSGALGQRDPKRGLVNRALADTAGRVHLRGALAQEA